MEFMFLSLIPEKIKVLIIGGGNAGLIKAKSFLKRGCSVTILSKEFHKRFEELKGSSLLELIEDSYSSDVLTPFHLIVVAVNQVGLRNEIISDCNSQAKLFLNCEDFKQGMFVMPVQRETENISYAVHTKGGNPRASKYLTQMLQEKLVEQDAFIGFTTSLRQRLKASKIKDELMAFTATEDFRFFFDKGIHMEVLNLFFGGDIVEFGDSDQKKQTGTNTD